MTSFQPSDSVAALRGWLRLTWSPIAYDRRCYCVLDGPTLSLFDSEDESQCFRRFPLSEIVGIDFFRGSGHPSFTFRTTAQSPLVFVCSSVPECERWICALRHPSPSDGVTLTDFEFVRLIGAGSSGKVRVARKFGTNEIYAVKSVRKDPQAETVKVNRIVAERNILMRASHPFITRLHWAFQTSTKFYFVMEYVRGGDLRHYLNQDKDFSSRQIRLYIAEIAVGLKQLHRLGIIYRDLKPENILLDEKGHIKLADFGLSRELGRDSQGRYSFCGTQEFLAPEMIKEEPQTFALDWWALGVLSYRLIIGCFPFQNDNPKRFFNWIVSRKPLIPKSIEINTESLLRGLLEKNPVHRIGSSGNDITEHPYFADLSWELVEAQAYEPDFRPPMSRDDSCGNFDREFTGQPGCDSFSLGDSCASLSSESDCMNVPGFSYEAETFLQ